MDYPKGTEHPSLKKNHGGKQVDEGEITMRLEVRRVGKNEPISKERRV